MVVLKVIGIVLLSMLYISVVISAEEDEDNTQGDNKDEQV